MICLQEEKVYESNETKFLLSSTRKLSLSLTNFSLNTSVLGVLSYFLSLYKQPISKISLIIEDNYRNHFFSDSRHHSKFSNWWVLLFESPLMTLYSLNQEMLPLIYSLTTEWWFIFPFYRVCTFDFVDINLEEISRCLLFNFVSKKIISMSREIS